MVVEQTLDENSQVARGDGWLSAWVDTEYVMMSADTGMCISLSETGGRIWELMEEPQTVASLCDKLAAEYDAPREVLLEDVYTFLGTLSAEEAVVVTAA